MDFKRQIASRIAAEGLSEQELYDMLALPPDTAMGDFALPCFRLAKTMRRSPVLIAEEIAAPAPAQKSSTDDERSLRRKRFAERRAALNSALKEQLIGENNRGFLELRADDAKVSAELKKLVEAENADRTTIFTNIARRQNSTPEFVGERFAARMAERAPSGIPIQNVQGEWNVKP